MEWEAPASRKVGSARGRKSTELQIMAGLPGSILRLAGDLGQVTPPLPHLPWLPGRLDALMHGKVMIVQGAVPM